VKRKLYEFARQVEKRKERGLIVVEGVNEISDMGQLSFLHTFTDSDSSISSPTPLNEVPVSSTNLTLLLSFNRLNEKEELREQIKRKWGENQSPLLSRIAHYIPLSTQDLGSGEYGDLDCDWEGGGEVDWELVNAVSIVCVGMVSCLSILLSLTTSRYNHLEYHIQK